MNNLSFTLRRALILCIISPLLSILLALLWGAAGVHFDLSPLIRRWVVAGTRLFPLHYGLTSLGVNARYVAILSLVMWNAKMGTMILRSGIAILFTAKLPSFILCCDRKATPEVCLVPPGGNEIIG
jgi:hypothetical protein